MLSEEEVKKLKEQFTVRKRVSSILMMCLALGVLALATWAWFANNHKVSSGITEVAADKNNIQVSYQIYSNTRAEAISEPVPNPGWSEIEVLDDDNMLNLYGFLKKPGDSVVIKVIVSNNNATTVNLSAVGFVPPTEKQEVANAKAALLGTQLYVAQVASETADTDETVSGKAGYVVLFDDSKNQGQQGKINVLNTPLTISGGASANVYMRVVFNESNVNQNEYKSFGKIITDENGDPVRDGEGNVKTDGYCARNLYVECNELNAY